MTGSENDLQQRHGAFASNPSAPSRWSIILAGGEGERLRPLIESRFGHHRPKQYCALTGSRTMLEHTYDRTAAIVPQGQRIMVIGPGHRAFLNHHHEYVSDRQAIIEQPHNRGTAVGIFLPLCFVLDHDLEATVLILPSDHFVLPEEGFVTHAETAMWAAERFPHHIILVGAEPDGPETDYGWIDTADSCTHHGLTARVLRVRRFCEKPAIDQASRLYAAGALWNTMIMAVKAKTLWELGQKCLPNLTEGLSDLVNLLHARRVGRFQSVDPMQLISQIFVSLDSFDFSAHVLQRVPSQTLAIPLRGVYWSDWGRPERVAESLDRIRSSHSFTFEGARRDPVSIHGT